jgi:hypothetical protein
VLGKLTFNTLDTVSLTVPELIVNVVEPVPFTPPPSVSITVNTPPLMVKPVAETLPLRLNTLLPTLPSLKVKIVTLTEF